MLEWWNQGGYDGLCMYLGWRKQETMSVPDIGDRDNIWNVGNSFHTDTDDFMKRLNSFQSLWKIQILYTREAVHAIQILGYLVVMKSHFELVKIEPLLCLLYIQIMEVVPGCEAKWVELPIGCKEKCCGCLLIIQTRVSSFKETQTCATVGTVSATSLDRNSSPQGDEIRFPERNNLPLFNMTVFQLSQ